MADAEGRTNPDFTHRGAVESFRDARGASATSPKAIAAHGGLFSKGFVRLHGVREGDGRAEGPDFRRRRSSGSVGEGLRAVAEGLRGAAEGLGRGGERFTRGADHAGTAKSSTATIHQRLPRRSRRPRRVAGRPSQCASQAAR